MREACIELRSKGYTCDRITHNELMASTGQEYTGNLIKGDYNLLWIATPSDWYVRTPDKISNPHWQRIQTWLRTATKLGMQVVMFGPPGFPWKIPNIKETIEDLSLHTTRMRLCHFGEKFNKQDSKPSGSYIQVVTNMPLKYKLWACRCSIPIDQHSLDWYGKTQEHAEWRRSVKRKFCRELCSYLFGTSPLSTSSRTKPRSTILEVTGDMHVDTDIDNDSEDSDVEHGNVHHTKPTQVMYGNVQPDKPKDVCKKGSS